ncbi:uncharacterized protein LOC128998765 isoform X2 [Macrosteles quadrilineatus]|uniref:uncharacterized protein LOC128998765 isoform X2 n=1 Tax=Macrosteles quadrilineatus TaxID=74068 RepID=UPI0023E1CB20|nr:uncharacterized protein LOC128998765 isoform X2 [Macrosteles quadrilineatus]
MEHHSSIKVFRAMLIGLCLLALFCGMIDASGLNIIGMPLSAHPMGDSMDFTMGGGKNCDDEEEEEEDDDDQPQNQCLDVKASAWTLSNMYRDQPLFMNFRPRTEEAMLIDNICYTFFPLPDDQFTYVMYSSTVYRDGSNLIESDIVTDVQLGIFRAASPYCTYKDHVLGYAGCDTFVMYRCYMSSECRNKNALFTFGLSQSCKQISISCLQKIEDIIQGNGIPEQDYVALPMKLPTKCVFEPVCTFKGEVEVFNAVDVIAPREIVVPFIEEEIEILPPPPVIVTSVADELFLPEFPVTLAPPVSIPPFLGYSRPSYLGRIPNVGRYSNYFPGRR